MMLKTNTYHDGKVLSIGGFSAENLNATVGVMQAGEYNFNTDAKETMKVISGSMLVQRPEDSAPITFSAGESFDVPANVSFSVTILEDTSYLCLYA